MKSRSFKKLTPVACVAASLALSRSAFAQAFNPNDLIVSGSTYQDVGQVAGLAVGQNLPGGGKAVDNGAFPNVFSNEKPDASFGVTSGIFLQDMTTAGSLVNTVNIDASQIITSFSSKSELGLNISSDGTTLTFMGYAGTAAGANGAAVGTEDVSNSNTPNHVDGSNPVTSSTQRAVGQVNLATGQLAVTDVNAYSGNNGRAAILVNNVNGTGQNNIYLVGNAGNGSGTEPNNIVNNTGVQMISAAGSGESTVVGVQQGTPGSSTGYQFGYAVQQDGNPADKSGKDDNFRGETIFNNTLYVTKGSGSNGKDTVYQVGTAGSLPTAGTAASTAITVLPGFSTALAGSATTHPFGLYFANATTLYVADEGDGTLANAGTANDPNAGLQKWTLAAGVWHLDYVLKQGLALGVNYASRITGYNATQIVTDGLRALAGKVNADGTVTLYSVTSTASNTADPSGNKGDTGADPNELVAITDDLANTTGTPDSGESFSILEEAQAGTVLRGVAFNAVPEPSTFAAGISGLLMLAGSVWRKRKK